MLRQRGLRLTAIPHLQKNLPLILGNPPHHVLDVVSHHPGTRHEHQRHQAAAKNVTPQRILGTVTELHRRRRLALRIKQSVDESEHRFDVVRRRGCRIEPLNRRMVRANIITAVVMLNQLERQETVVQEPRQQIGRYAGESDDNHQRIDQPCECGIHQVVQPLWGTPTNNVLPTLRRVVSDRARINAGVLTRLRRHKVGVRLLKIHTHRGRIKHAIHAGNLLDDRFENVPQRPAQVNRGAQHRIQHRFRRASDLRPVHRGKHIRRLVQVRPPVRLRITRKPQIHARIHTIRLGHVFDDGLNCFHPHRAGHHRRRVQQRIGARHIHRGSQHAGERLHRQPVTRQRLQHSAEPRPDIRIQRQAVVDELQPPGLQPQSAFCDHVLHDGLQRPHEHRVRERLRLNRKPPRRPNHVVVEDVADTAQFSGAGPCAVTVLVGVVLRVERIPQTRGLDGHTDHRLFAVHEQRDERAVPFEDDPAGFNIVARVSTRRLDQIATNRAHRLPKLVAHREPERRVYLRFAFRQRPRGSCDPVGVARLEGRLPCGRFAFKLRQPSTLLSGHHQFSPRARKTTGPSNSSR
ncbi:hypothetical protein Henu3_gp70 [Mycobacterium phage Henu3 PeY-2017]|nr:hypothetical protein Henu3_gp70 [Mycobacterium phage Henu3 PeY-2017]